MCKLLEALYICFLNLPSFLRVVNMKIRAILDRDSTISQSAISVFTFPIRLTRSLRAATACDGCNEAFQDINQYGRKLQLKELPGKSLQALQDTPAVIESPF
jgi:hypothetical protein